MKITSSSAWPELNFGQLKDTIATVHMWTQIVGKIRLVKSPWTNHSWHVTSYVTPTGLSTGSIPYEQGIFQIDFDFNTHLLRITTSSGSKTAFELEDKSVADFYDDLNNHLKMAGIEADIHAAPNEVDPAIPFAEDTTHCAYDPKAMYNLWQAMIRVHNVFTVFRARFTGKCSPVHFFWGAFDLAVTRFSGRPAPIHPGGAPNMPLPVMQEAYSHEVSSCGFWPGSEQFPEAVFYAYCYPTPSDFKQQPLQPQQAFYSEEMGEFMLKYDDVRAANDPEETLMEFLQTTYEAAANTGHWDRKNLECDLTRFER